MINHCQSCPGLVTISLAKNLVFSFNHAEETPIVWRNTLQSSSISSSRGASDMKARASKTAAKAVALSLLACFSTASCDSLSILFSGIYLNPLCNFHDCTLWGYVSHFLTRNQTGYGG